MSCGCKATANGGGAIAGAIGPEVAQQASSRRNTLSTLLAAIGVGPIGTTYAGGDVWSPQQTIRGIELVDLVDEREVDTSTSWPSLPGRLVAPSAWDGESGAMAPAAVGGWWV